MGDGKVTFDVELDKSKLDPQIKAVKKEVSALENASPTITVKATTSGAVGNLEAVKKAANEVDSKTPEVKVTATDAASTTLHDVAKTADQTDAKTPDIEVTATDSATEPMEDIQATADKTDGKAPDINVTVSDAATAPLEDVQAVADTTDAKTPNINVTVSDAASTPLSDIQTKADATGDKKPIVSVSADTSAAASSLEELDSYIDSKSSKWSSLLQGVGQGIGGAITGGVKNAVSSGLGAIFSGGSSFETGLAKVATLLPKEFDKAGLGDALLDMSTQYGVDVTDIEEAAYSALSAGVQSGEGGKNLLSYLEGSLKLGVGGFTSTTSAVDAVSSIMNAYGMDKSDASQQNEIANILLKTQNAGQTTVDELSSSISQVTSIASVNGVQMTEVGAMLSTITAQGTDTAQAVTQSRSLINELAANNTQASQNLAKAFKGTEYAGMSFQEAMGSGANMVDVLKQMDVYAKKNNLSLYGHVFLGGSWPGGACAIER